MVNSQLLCICYGHEFMRATMSFFFSNRATMSLTTNDFHPKTRKIDLNSQVYALGLSDESFT